MDGGEGGRRQTNANINKESQKIKLALRRCIRNQTQTNKLKILQGCTCAADVEHPLFLFALMQHKAYTITVSGSWE